MTNVFEKLFIPRIAIPCNTVIELLNILWSWGKDACSHAMFCKFNYLLQDSCLPNLLLFYYVTFITGLFVSDKVYGKILFFKKMVLVSFQKVTQNIKQ